MLIAAQSPFTNALRNAAKLLGRVLLALLFLVAGLGKVAAYPATMSYMAANGAPGVLSPLVVLTEVGGAIAIFPGWKARIVSILLAGFSLLAALLFHHNFADQVAPPCVGFGSSADIDTNSAIAPRGNSR